MFRQGSQTLHVCWLRQTQKLNHLDLQEHCGMLHRPQCDIMRMHARSRAVGVITPIYLIPIGTVPWAVSNSPVVRFGLKRECFIRFNAFTGLFGSQTPCTLLLWHTTYYVDQHRPLEFGSDYPQQSLAWAASNV